jgi:hypothetical protein
MLERLGISQPRAWQMKPADADFGKAARVSPRANMGKPPLPAFVLQLEEARAEWRRRYPSETEYPALAMLDRPTGQRGKAAESV